MNHWTFFGLATAAGVVGLVACGASTHGAVALDDGNEAGADATAPEAGGGTPSPSVTCQSMADCTGGEVCCLTDILSMTVTCEPTCPLLPFVNTVAQVCKDSRECQGAGEACDTVTGFGVSYRFCGPPVPDGGGAPVMDAASDVASAAEDGGDSGGPAEDGGGDGGGSAEDGGDASTADAGTPDEGGTVTDAAADAGDG